MSDDIGCTNSLPYLLVFKSIMILFFLRTVFCFVVEKLKEGNVKIPEPEEPLGVGSWMKPEPLRNAENEFLCMKAFVRSPESDSMCIQEIFMIDTGSDVVTLQPETIEILGLNIIRTVTSHGVHSVAEKQLYAAVFRIKDVEIDIEVCTDFKIYVFIFRFCYCFTVAIMKS